MNSKSRLGRRGPNKLALLGSTALVVALGMPGAWAQADETDPDAQVENVSDNTTEEEARQDTVVVQGIRGSLSNAQAIKRDADTFVDSITASDVSTLPDLSVAEALARVPGVVVQRFTLGNSDADFPSPEGSGNLIRGLQFVRSEFNGRDAFSANGGRSLDWSSVPPELIGGVDVYKNQSADLIEGGIGGSINLRTLEPFDRDGMTAVFIADGTYTDLAEEWSPGFSAVLGNRWETDMGEFGLLGSASTSELKSLINGFQLGQLTPLVDPTGSNPDLSGRDDPNATAADRIAVPTGFQLRTNEVERIRDSYYLAGQWRSPDGDMELTAKYIRVENEVDSDERTLEWFHDGESWRGTDILGALETTPFSSDGLSVCNGSNDTAFEGIGSCEQTRPVSGGLFEAGIISNNLRDWTGARGANFSNLGINQVQESMTQDLSLNFKWRPADQWFVELDGHVTEAESSLERLWIGTRFFSDFYLRPDLDNPEVTLILDPENNPNRRAGTGPVPTSSSDPNSSFLLFAADQFEDNDGDLYALRGDVEYEFADDGWFDSVQFGARYAEREQTNRAAGLNWAGVAPPWAGGGYLPYAEISQPATELVDFSGFFRGGVVRGPNTEVIFPSRTLLNDYDSFAALVASDPNITPGDGSFGPDWNPLRTDGVVDYSRGTIGEITETTENFYARLNFGNEFENGMSLDGNIGMRYSSTTVTSEGSLDYVEFSDDTTPGINDNPREFLPEAAAYFDQASISGDSDRTDERWLPSLNVKWNLNDDMLIRFGYSEAITRPNVSDLRADQSAFGPTTFFVNPDAGPDDPDRVTDIVLQEVRIQGGNPDLEPIEATNWDLSFEWYFGDDSSFTASVFRKELDNIIIFSEQNIGSVTLDGNTVPINFIGLINQDEGEINGIELAYTQFYDFLPGAFGNLGLQANYTYIDSEATPLPEFQDADGDGQADNFDTTFRFGIDRLLGLSEHTANIVGIYQDDRLEARLAYNWRSDYVGSYRDFITGNPIFQEETGFLDASLKYDLTDQVQLRFQAANLLDTKNKATQQVDAAGQRYGRSSFIFDRRFEFGIRWQY